MGVPACEQQRAAYSRMMSLSAVTNSHPLLAEAAAPAGPVHAGRQAAHDAPPQNPSSAVWGRPPFLRPLESGEGVNSNRQLHSRPSTLEKKQDGQPLIKPRAGRAIYFSGPLKTIGSCSFFQIYLAGAFRTTLALRPECWIFWIPPHGREWNGV